MQWRCPQTIKTGGFVKRTVEAVLRNKDNVVFPDKEKAPIENICVYHSHPRWIVDKWLTELQSIEEVEALCLANNIEPPLTIRVNPLKSDRESLKKALEAQGYASSMTEFSPFGLVINKKEDIFKTESFANGLFEVQDEEASLLQCSQEQSRVNLSSMHARQWWKIPVPCRTHEKPWNSDRF